MGSGQVVQPDLYHPHIQPGEGTFAAPFLQDEEVCLPLQEGQERAISLTPKAAALLLLKACFSVFAVSAHTTSACPVTHS